ncbi:hypothetical protein A1O3_06066 [Capronia epimyces CBS 606.96]|uniref:Zn(2)-C6 fungal-type domain-containing protein n=1 Tax=Capronia epimyces CBS 606.96 TaxID=1182542 RepID=W9XPU3_9EURO|nr:uncharacterized protein A1O3_06066 [Capronia epimyces CBS 606.96]EXJ82253.1 hypothetical protein A1O3_06066 [Capronia epimyces CBS 606.96]
MPSVEQRRSHGRKKPRSKTYSGCWTCRARKVKCGEEKPSCRRCSVASLVCQGYNVKLVWGPDDGDDRRNLVARRSTLDGHEHLRPVLSHRFLQSALNQIDACKADASLQVGPFSVFAASPLTENEDRVVGGAGPVQFVDPGNAPDTDEDELESVSPPDVSWIDTPDPSLLDEEDDIATNEIEIATDEIALNEHVTPDGAATNSAIGLKQQIIPHLPLYLSSSSPDERQLLRFWITDLSGMMIPTPRKDNPFQTIFIPLALSASQDPDLGSGHAALLHAIYAVSAFNRAQVSETKEHFLAVGTKHHQKSMQYLRRNLTQTGESQREALLATIIAMSSIEVIRGTSSTWRIHLTGGRTWLQAICAQGWANKYSANTLQQIFLCIEALNSRHRRSAGAQDPQVPADPLMIEGGSPVEYTWTEYILDKVFGITEGIFNSLLRINQLSRRGAPAPSNELDELEQQIKLSDPDALVPEVGEEYDQLTQHHACAFYNACLIHFHRTLKRTAPARLQRLVRRSLYHLGEINRLESDKNVCGLLWPLFITACEVDVSSKLRHTCIRLFDKGHLLGIGNMCSAANVVLEVWQRRDEDQLGVDITWQDVMDDLGIDILLT